MKTKDRNQKGFTIIEVLIVLAIAGLILLIVFLAVPALQRNSRNTQRKNEVSGIIGAMSEFTNNNAGTLPATCGATPTGGVDPIGNPATAVLVAPASAANDCSAGTGATIKDQLWLKNANVKFYPATQVGFINNAGAVAAPAPVSDTNGVIVENYLKCSGTSPTAAGASSRSVVALYGVESGGKNQAQCVESGS